MIVTAALMGLLISGQPSPSPVDPIELKANEGITRVMDSKCPVTGKMVAPDKGVRVVVRGKDYLVFDQAAADELTANPDKYLDPDGMPKNSKK